MKSSEVVAVLNYSQLVEERAQLVKVIELARSKGHTGIIRVSEEFIASIDLDLGKLELKVHSSYEPTNNDIQAAG